MKRRKNLNRYRGSKTPRGQGLKTLLKVLLGFVGVVGLVLVLSAGLARSYFALLEADWLRVQDIVITGTKHIGRDEILNALMVPRNASILTLKTAELAERVFALPWVENTVVRLELPKRLVVEIVERDPLAIVQGDQFFLMDKDGKLFARADQSKNPGLPLVTGFSGADMRVGGYMPSLALEEIKELLASLDRVKGWLPREAIAECRWHEDQGFVLFTSRGAFPIHLGSEDFDEKLTRLEKLFRMLTDRQWMEFVTRIDLDFPSRGYVEGNFPFPGLSKGT